MADTNETAPENVTPEAPATEAPAEAQTPEIQAPETPAETPAEAPAEVPKERNWKKDCWNCGEKLVKGVCKACGFDINLINNTRLDG